jgi:Ca-activated chloride channel family protein
MKFAEPLWLFAGAFVILTLIWLYRRFDRRQRAALADFASSHLLARLTASFSPGRRRLKRFLFATALGLIFVALARPEWGYHWETQNRRGIDILFAIDTSKSMLTQDVNPDRLTRAKLGVTDLVSKLDGDRVGLIAFAGDAFLEAPLTLDYEAFQESLDATDVGVVPRGGTNIASAIEEAQAVFGQEAHNQKILVLITDGEDLDAKGIEAARAAAATGLKIYTVGVGSAAGGLIPVPGANGGTDFLKNASGQFVKSHLDEDTLRQIAQVTGGLYEPLGQQGQGLVALYDKALAPLPKHELASRAQRVYDERYQGPLALALVLLLAGTLIGTRKSDWRAAWRQKQALQTASLLGMLLLMAGSSQAQASPQAAEQAYLKGNFTNAEKLYASAAAQNPGTAPLQFDLGAAAYKVADYDKALPAFQKALGTDEVGVQQQAYYNIGNTQYRLGQKTEKAKPEKTISNWESAVQSYNAALKLKPQDADAKFNRDFVQKKLDELKQQQKQNQNQKNQQQSQQDKNQTQNKSQQNQQSNQAAQQPQNQPQQGSQKNQSPGNQANQKGSDQGQGSPKNEAQNGKPDQQNQAGQNSTQNKNGSQGQPQNQSASQPQTAENQGGQKSETDQSPSPSGNSGENGSLAQNGEKPAGPRGVTIPDKASSKQDHVVENDAQIDQPGQMNRQEARDLLNSLRGNEHVLPATADARNGENHAPDAQTFKDW